MGRTINMQRGTKVALPKAFGAGKLRGKHSLKPDNKRIRCNAPPHPSAAPLPASVLEALVHDTPTILTRWNRR